MKMLILSDIHGIKTNLEIIEERLNKDYYDKIIILGDLFYNGSSDKYGKEYDLSYVKEFLNKYRKRIICLIGNCDSKEELEECNFLSTSNLASIEVDSLNIYFTHGHIYNETNWDKDNSILVFGHYHIPFIKENNNMIFINSGSISLPKDNYLPSYLIYDNRKFTIYDINNKIIAEKEL